MLESEMDEHLVYAPYERTDSTNARNGKKSKTIRSKYGEMEIDVPQDRESSFEPKVVQKRQKDISAMYAKGLTTRQIPEQVEDMYGFEVSQGLVSDITDFVNNSFVYKTRISI
jgi:transposase-like protein